MIELLLMAAATVAPAKLVIIPSGSQPAVVAYPSQERCDRARQALLSQVEADQQRQRVPANVPVIRRGVQAYCIPG